MTTLPSHQRLTWEEYLALEDSTGQKHEYYDGVVRAMAGGSPVHSLIGCNINAALKVRLKGKPCQPFNSDLRIRTGLKTHYPDASVACPPLRFDDLLPNTILNPTAIFEVLSDSTEEYDRGLKFFCYRQIPELTDNVIVNPDTEWVEHRYKAADGRWIHAAYAKPDGLLKLRSLGIEIPTLEFFDGTEPFRVRRGS